MALTRAQLLSGNSAQGVVLPGQVQAVKQGVGITIASDGTISFDPSTATGIVRTNNTLAYNSYVWPTLATAPSAGTILQSDGAGGVNWTANYVPTTGPTGAAQLPVGITAQRPFVPVAGEIRYNSERDVLEYYDGTNWVAVVSVDPTPGPNPTIGFGLAVDGTAIKVSIACTNPAPAASTLPADAMDGSLYWDDNLGVLFIYYNDGTSSQWVQVTPAPVPTAGATGSFTSADGKAVTVVNGVVTSIV